MIKGTLRYPYELVGSKPNSYEYCLLGRQFVVDDVDCQVFKEALLNRDIVKGFWTLLAGGAFNIHSTARNHDELDEDGFFPREVRAVKAQYAPVNEDKPDDPNREFLLKCVCTV